MIGYLALLLLLAGLGGLVLRAGWIGYATGLAGCLFSVVLQLPVASVNLPLGPALVVAFGPAEAPFIGAILFCGLAGTLLDPSRGKALAGLSVLATGALLCADVLHLAALAALYAIASWWSGRRRDHRGGSLLRVVWPVLGGTAALGIAASPRNSVLFVAGGVSLSLALARAGTFAWWRAPSPSPSRADAWSGGVGLLVALALAGRMIGWAAGPGISADDLPYASAAAIALRTQGSAQGAMMLLGGLLIAAIATHRGLRAAGLRAALGEIGCAQLGLVWTAAGLAGLAGGASLPGLAAEARGAAFLLVVTAGLGRIAGLCALETLTESAGHDRFDRLGGLAWLMPVQGAILAAGLAQMVPIPPAAGFAAAWALLQALYAAPAIGDLALRCGLLVVTGVVAAILAGLVGIALRSASLALLGRPRTPRAAGAEDRRGAALWLPVVPLALLTVTGLLPGLALRVSQGQENGLRLDAASGAIYAPWVLGLLMAMLGGVLLLRRRSVQPAAEVAFWQDGVAPPPAWLPFGDPDTQPGDDFLRPARLPAARFGAVARRVRRLTISVPDPALLPGALGVVLVVSLLGLVL